MAVQEPRTNRWVATLAMAFLFTASWPMHAIAEQALPTSAAVYTNPVCANFKLLSSCQASTPQAACDLFYSSPWGGLQPNPVFTRMFLIGVNSYQCNYNYYIAAYPYGMIYHPDSALASAVLTISPTCPNATPPYTFNPGTGMCERPDQCLLPNVINPANGKCESPYPSPDVPDPATGQCVTCTVSLASIEIADPVAKLYEDGTYNSTDKPDLIHLNQATLTGLACIVQKVNAINCYKTPRPTSGYRPTAYQKHIRDVYDNWMKIKDNNSPECAERKNAAEAEYNEHKPFARRPGATSNHSQLDAAGNPAGNAVDISGVPDNALDSADAIAAQCNMKRPLMNMPNPADNDPIHYQPK